MSEKVYSNPARLVKKEYKKYVPNYVAQGIEPIESDFSHRVEEKVSIPNVGSSDWVMFDDQVIDPNHKVIDNNDFVDVPGLPSQKEDRPFSSDNYVILYNEALIFQGNYDDTIEKINALVFGEIEEFGEVDPNKLILLKKMKIKVGVFIE